VPGGTAAGHTFSPEYYDPYLVEKLELGWIDGHRFITTITQQLAVADVGRPKGLSFSAVTLLTPANGFSHESAPVRGFHSPSSL
jgi:hypothetical protein